MGDAHLETSPLQPGMRQHDGRSAGIAALSKPTAIGIAALSVALCAGALALLWFAPAHHAYRYDISGDLVVGSVFPLVGALIAVREPGNRCRWAQLQWLLLGFVACVLLLIPVFLLQASVPGVNYGLTVAFALIPLAVAVAIVRHGLFDIELVVNRAVVYGTLTVFGLAAYAALLAVTGARAGRGTYAPLLAAVIAAALTAARSRFQHVVDRRLFGARRDPYEVVRRVGVTIAAARTPDEALATSSPPCAKRSPFLTPPSSRRVRPGGAPSARSPAARWPG